MLAYIQRRQHPERWQDAQATLDKKVEWKKTGTWPTHAQRSDIKKGSEREAVYKRESRRPVVAEINWEEAKRLDAAVRAGRMTTAGTKRPNLLSS